MPSEGYSRKLTAILSADVKGYSCLMGDDDAATVRTITAYRQVVTSLVWDHRGRVVDSPGDSILAEFPSAEWAVQCAVKIQQALTRDTLGATARTWSRAQVQMRRTATSFSTSSMHREAASCSR